MRSSQYVKSMVPLLAGRKVGHTSTVGVCATSGMGLGTTTSNLVSASDDERRRVTAAW